MASVSACGDECALEVVVVALGAIVAGAMAVQDLLDLLEGRGVDQCLVASLAVDEIVRERGNRVDALDAMDRLHSAGLIHRNGEFVFATRAAVRFSQIVG